MPRRRYLTTEKGRDRQLSAVSDKAAVCYLLATPHADCCGRLPGDPFEYVCQVAAGRRYSDDEAEAIVADLTEHGLYLAWEAGGKRVLAIPARTFLEEQGKALNEASRPEQPEPPDELGGVLRRGYKLQEEYARYGVTAGPGRGRVAKGKPKREAPAGGDAGCSWCAHPTAIGDSSQPRPRRLAQAYHDAYRARFGRCPLCLAGSRETGKEFSALSRILAAAAGDLPRAVELIQAGVRSEDAFLGKAGHTPAIIATNLDGIAEALERGETHGRRSGAAASGGRNAGTDRQRIADSWATGEQRVGGGGAPGEADPDGDPGAGGAAGGPSV